MRSPCGLHALTIQTASTQHYLGPSKRCRSPNKHTVTHSTSPLGRPTRVRRSVGSAACLWQRFLPLPTLSNQSPGRHAHLSRTDLRSAANVQANGVQYLLRQAAGEPTAAARITAPFTAELLIRDLLPIPGLAQTRLRVTTRLGYSARLAVAEPC